MSPRPFPVRELTQEYLREILHYNPRTGKWRWIKPIDVKTKPGDRAGGFDPMGYTQISIHKKRYRGHRLAFLYMLGYWPVEVDHKGKKTDDRWHMIREATRSQNLVNIGKRIGNKSGFKGVYRSRNRKRWCATIRIGGKNVFLGTYDTPEKAHKIYFQTAKKHYGEFARA